VALAPDQGHTKYLMLAQLQEGMAAVATYETAVALLTRAADAALADTEVGPVCVSFCLSLCMCMCVYNGTPLSKAGAWQEHKGLCRELATAYCAMTELFLTDCWSVSLTPSHAHAGVSMRV
jgi:hypothetical protein